jgi:hypothetical protein
MHRLDRRLILLRGKRKSVVTRQMRTIERALRDRTARKVRHLLRRNLPVVLLTPRWSCAREFLDDVGVDLAVGKPTVVCRTLSMAPMAGRTVHDSRQWLSRAIIEFCELYVPGPVWQAVDRTGFRYVMRDLLRRARTGPRRALLVHGLEHLHVEALQDFVEVFGEHVAEFGGERRLNVVLGGSVDMASFEFPGAARVTLRDYSREEAAHALVEVTGPIDRALVDAAIDLVGGVPGLLSALGDAALGGHWLSTKRADVLRALGGVGDEIRGAIDIVRSDVQLAERLDEILRRSPAPLDAERDDPMLRAGILQTLDGGRVGVRAPLFAEWLGG